MMRKALVVGINRYPYLKDSQNNAQHLNAPAADADAITHLFRQYGQFEVTLLPETCSNRVDREQDGVTEKKLIEEISELFNPEEGEVPRTALLFFAGHGLLKSLPHNKEVYLATSDTDKRERWGIGLGWLLQKLIDSPVSEQIVWLDCCHSGEFTNLAFAQANGGNGGRENVNRSFIAACRDTETAYGVKGQGILTSLLLRGLDPYQNPRGKWINSKNLDAFINDELRNDANLNRFQQRFRSNTVGEPINFWQMLGSQMLGSHQTEIESYPSKWRVTQQFQALIADKTQEFVGREYVFEAIAKFTATESKGYFIIQADPGVGKSAIAARLVMQMDCVAHFNVRSEGVIRVDQFLENVCHELMRRYELDYRQLPNNATQDGRFLGLLLNKVSYQLGSGEKLVIVIDALDEVDLSNRSAGANVLYLPRSLPNGVYFILTQRSVNELLLRVDPQTPQKLFDLIAYREESLKDVQTYIGQRVANSQTLQKWIASKQLAEEEFIAQLAQKSDNNFMYLYYIIGDIQEGAYQDASIESLPQGLEGYYEEHWELMGLNAKPRSRNKFKIVSVLAQACQPISCRLIAREAAENEFAVQAVLDNWKQFLRQQRGTRPICYSIYHNSFRDFLYSKEIVKAAGGHKDE